MPEIVITEFMDETAVAGLAAEYDVAYDAGLPDRPDELRHLVGDCRALIVRNRTQVQGALLDACPRLVVVGRLGVGLDNIDLAACRARRIEVCPATGVNDASVAEYVVCGVLMLLRGAYHATAEVLAGAWPRTRLIGREIGGRRLGLVGFGAIARQTARRAVALGMEVVAHDPYLPDDDPAWAEHGAASLPFADLLATADAVSLHVPLTAGTRNLIDAAAAITAEALVAAEVDGIGSHGLSRLPAYADQVLSGKIDGAAVPELAWTGAATVRVDARCGFAFPAIAAGLDAAMARVPETGLVAVAVRNSHHAGVLGHHVERLAARGFAGLGFSNSPAAIAPWGGAVGVFGTNPIAFAVPRAGRPPLVIDTALSKVARGKIMLAAQQARPIPEGWALDHDGRPTTDARAALAGTMLPLGDAKGAALVLMVEVLAAVLTGGQFGFEASSFFTADGPPPRIGQLFLVFRHERLGGSDVLARLEVLLGAILAQPGTRLPGDRRQAARERAGREGIAVDAALLAALRRSAGQPG